MRPAHPRAVGEVAFHAQVRMGEDVVHRLVDELVALVAVAGGELAALLDVNDHRDGDERTLRPANVTGRAAMKVADHETWNRRPHPVMGLGSWPMVRSAPHIAVATVS